MIYREVADRIAELQIAENSVFYFIGFNILNRAEEHIIHTLQKKYNAHFIADADDYYIKDEVQEAGRFLRKYQSGINISSPGEVNNLSSSSLNIQIVGNARNMGQIKVATDILSNKLALNPEAEKETVIIVLDEKLLNPLLSAIPSNVDALNISMGFPLANSKIASFLRILFSLHENARRFKGSKANKRGFYYKDIFDLLQHPFGLLLLNDKSDEAGFIAEIQKGNRISISYDWLVSRFKPTVSEHLFGQALDPGQYLQNLQELLLALKDELTIEIQAENDNSIDLELLLKAIELISVLSAALKDGAAYLSLKALRKLLMDEIKAIRIGI